MAGLCFLSCTFDLLSSEQSCWLGLSRKAKAGMRLDPLNCPTRDSVLIWNHSGLKDSCFIRMVEVYCWCTRMLQFILFLTSFSPKLVTASCPAVLCVDKSSACVCAQVANHRQHRDGFSICPSPKKSSLEPAFCGRCVLSGVCETSTCRQGKYRAVFCKPASCGALRSCQVQFQQLSRCHALPELLHFSVPGRCSIFSCMTVV